MLTLGRKEGEKITIKHNGEKLEVIVTQAKNGRVRLSFDGPEEFQILRNELEE